MKLSTDLMKHTFKKIANKSKDAWLLLKYIAFLDSDKINCTILMEIMGKTTEEIQNEINIIKTYTVLIKCFCPNENEKLITFHEDTQDLIKKQLKKEEVSEIMQILINKVNNAIPEIPEGNEIPEEDFSKTHAYLEHARALIEETNDNKIENINGMASLCSKVDKYTKRKIHYIQNRAKNAIKDLKFCHYLPSSISKDKLFDQKEDK